MQAGQNPDMMWSSSSQILLTVKTFFFALFTQDSSNTFTVRCETTVLLTLLLPSLCLSLHVISIHNFTTVGLSGESIPQNLREEKQTNLPKADHRTLEQSPSRSVGIKRENSHNITIFY